MSSIRSKMFILLGRVLHTVQDVLSSYPCLPYDRVCFLFLRPILHSDSILIFLFCTSFLVVSSIRSKMFLVLGRVLHTVQDVLSSYPCLPYDRVCFLFLRPILHSDSILIFLFCTSFLVVSSIRSKMFLVLGRVFHTVQDVLSS